jgi:carbamoyl-phosphate synthase small subunit
LKAALILENGRVFYGQSIGDSSERVFEMVFNTSMVGYQEALTDPSYTGQGVIMTYPLIGNYGVNKEDNETGHVWPEALIIRRLSERGSNFRCEGSLGEYLKENGVTGIEDVDTRELTRILRDEGTMNAMITARDFCLDEVLKRIRDYRIKKPVYRVTRSEPLNIKGNGPKVALMDFGVKRGMVQCLVKRGCDVTVLPATTGAEEILRGGYDGLMLSGGPGDPKDCADIVRELSIIYESDIPVFGVCLGHQLMALATGADTVKLKYGHRGGNHPVRDLTRNRVYITSQNHGYTVLADSVKPEVAEVSHINANDKTVEGLVYKRRHIFTVQFHPEACPGPADTEYLFDEFISMIKGCQVNA